MMQSLVWVWSIGMYMYIFKICYLSIDVNDYFIDI